MPGHPFDNGMPRILIEYRVDNTRHTQLFNLADDPHELHNLTGDPAHAATLARLRKLLDQQRVRLNDGHTPFPFTNQQGKTFWSACQSIAAPYASRTEYSWGV